jgi:hypothetical protein
MDNVHEHSNGLVSLEWLQKDMATTYLNILAEKANRLLDQGGAYELDTAAIFVEPLLRGLGWDTLDHEKVDRAPAGPYPDVELYGTEGDSTAKRVAAIEIKRLDTDDAFFRTSALDQLHRYVSYCLSGSVGKPDWVLKLRNEPIICGVLTNGRWWLAYDFHGKGRELKCDFNLQSTQDLQAFRQTLERSHLLKRLGLST